MIALYVSSVGFFGTSLTVTSTKSLSLMKEEEIFEKNPYMAKIYPTQKSREALTVFHLDQGEGEYFDLSQLPPFRQSFSFGGLKTREAAYRICAEKCIGCQGCLSVCPTGCISRTVPRVIDASHCLHCGNCMNICPVNAVVKG